MFKINKILLAVSLSFAGLSVYAEEHISINRQGGGGETHVNVSHEGTYHQGQYHSATHENLNTYGNNRVGNDRFNNDRVGNDRFNNDTVNVYGHNSYNGGYPPYRGWNQGPVGFDNGWGSGWHDGYNNGGWGAGLVEGLIGGIAATSLFNYFFNHNNSTPVVYSGGGGYSSGSSYSSSDMSTPPPEDTNNTTTNNTVIEEDNSNPGYWLLGIGVLVLAGLGIAYAMRGNKRREYYSDERRDSYSVNHRRYDDSRYDDYQDEPEGYQRIEPRQPSNRSYSNTRIRRRDRQV
ncbi:MAG: hypothetical protein EKK54_11440 [Neisseriaceae bacterium]|nr:MAG: hypothetical protein EKK54_11440 [Neisseriaceae bacterium]